MEDYASIIGLNYSGAKMLLRSPSHYQAWLNGEQEDTPALKFGRLVHTATFLPKEFNSTVVISPEDAPKRPTQKQINAKKPSPATVEAVAFWKKFDESLPANAEVVDNDTYGEVCAVTESAEKAIASLGCDITKWEAEKPVYKEWGGAIIKGRPDLITEIGGEKVVIDLKTTQDAAEQSFARDVFNFKYFLQAAFYLELTGAKRFILVAVEKEAPYAAKVYELDEASVAEGRKLMESAMATYVQCLKFNVWPSYDSGLTTLSLPRYAFTSTQNQ